MATTTKMAIPYPASTDLVKDGATNMQSLATQVDAKSGLVLLNTTSFTTVASQTMSSVFSSNFDNYLVVTDLTAVSTTLQVLYRLVDSGGTPNSTSNYYSADAESNVSAVTNRYSGAGSSWNFSQGTITVGGVFYMNVNQPFASTTTRGTHQLFTGGATATEWRGGSGSMVHNVASSYTGIQILTSTGTISGKVSVYGYNL